MAKEPKEQKERLDVLLVQNGLAPSREKAKVLIMAGEVLVNGQREDKAGSTFPAGSTVTLKNSKPFPFVSRGGLKLDKAVKCFGLQLSGRVCMDVGSSTGGFTDCMLQNGAAKVYAVDVGHGQLDWKLREDSRVVCMERTNIRYVVPSDIAEPPSFVSVDVSFISLTKVLGPVKELMDAEGELVTLIKPQFEAGREKGRKKRRGAGSGSSQGGHRPGCEFCAGDRTFSFRSGFFSGEGAGGKYRIPSLQQKDRKSGDRTSGFRGRRENKRGSSRGA